MLRQLLAALLLPVFLAGCVTAKPKTLRFDEKNSGTTVICDVKDDLVIHLKANPTTGYLWKSAALPDTDVIRLVDERYLQPKNDGRTGVPGIRVFRYHVVGSGEAAVNLEYRRPWEDKNLPPAAVFQLRVRVRQLKQGKLFNDNYQTPRRGSKGQIEPMPEGILPR